MAFPWFKKEKKNYPDFFQEYLDLFESKSNPEIEATRFVAFDTETTGFDTKEDRVLSIGAVAFTGKRISVKNTLEVYVHQQVFKPETVMIHELLRTGKEKISEIEAIKAFLNFIKDSVLIAHHANFDKNMMNAMLKRNGLEKLKNTFIDTGVLYRKSKHIIYRENLPHYSLDDLCKELNVPKVDRHTASGDALITAVVFLKILARLDKQKHLNWDYLLSGY